MNSRLYRSTFKISLITLFIIESLSACSTAPDLPPNLPSTAVLKSNHQQHFLGPGDLVEIRVYLEPELSGLYRVTPIGSFIFPLIGEVAAYKFDIVTLSEEIQRRLRERYIRDPQVTVILKESRSKKIFVLGMVHKPGSYVFEPSMKVVQAIALAGGLKALASRDLVLIRESSQGKEQKFRVPFREISQGQAQNSSLRPGDIIYVPESWY